jgi:hypothetical protein
MSGFYSKKKEQGYISNEEGQYKKSITNEDSQSNMNENGNFAYLTIERADLHVTQYSLNSKL